MHFPFLITKRKIDRIWNLQKLIKTYVHKRVLVSLSQFLTEGVWIHTPSVLSIFYRFGGNESWSGCCVVVVILFKMWKTRKKALRLAFISWFVLIFFIFVSNLQETYIHSWYILDTFLALLNNSVIIPMTTVSSMKTTRN